LGQQSQTLTQAASLTVAATDDASGVVGGEYFIGLTDPGQGNGTAMSWDSANLTASFDTSLTVGQYRVNVRAIDAAGNWSTVESSDLVVFDATGLTDVAGSKQVVPQLASGDSLPGLLSDTQNDKANLSFDIAYTATGSISPISYLTLDYSTGKSCNSPHPDNCHETQFTVNTVSPNMFDWLTITGPGSSLGTSQGQGTLTVDGVTTTNPFKILASDGDRTTPASADNAVLYIHAPGANPSTDSPLYQLHVNGNGNLVKIQ